MTLCPISRVALVTLLLAACSDPGPGPEVATPEQTSPMDVHSHASASPARIEHLDLDLQVDMTERRLLGTASYRIRPHGADTIILDTDALEIAKVTVNGKEVPVLLGAPSILGRALHIPIDSNSTTIAVTYRTTEGARALQWLSPQQTADRTHPFLFTQGQAILTRTWMPVQDSPGIRITYDATVRVPKELMAVMSASNPQVRSADGVYTFHMEQPIPAYLIALAVGDIEFRPLGERCGVYAERSVVDKAAWEFADTERMLQAAEALYGPYRWGRYDVIVLPPSFPFGGMENPRLTFATPTIIAGDRSLTALIAHELAHSWSGNLVTNATWNDFWLNEGFTVYFENRISEALYGADHAGMLQILGRQDLQGSLEHMHATGHAEDTHLRLHLDGRDPDDGMTDIAYEKGFAFLKLLESKVGRERFDAFLRGYFDRFAFQSMTTDKFLAYLDEELLKPTNTKVDIAAWVDGPGLPADAPVPVSDKFDQVDREIARWQGGTPAAGLATQGWNTFQWMHFLRHLPKDLTTAQLNDLDAAFKFTSSGNAEVLAAWLEQCIRNDHDAAYSALDRFLSTVGRRKFLVPLYKELIATEKGRVMARTIYASARSNYHAVAVRTLDEMLDWSATKPEATF